MSFIETNGIRALLLLSTVAVATGCDSKVDIEDGTGGSSSSTTKGSSVSGGQTTGSVTTGGACSGFEDAPDQQKLIVRFHNESGFPIYLPSTCGDPSFQIDPLGGSPDNVTYAYSDFCLQTCFDRQTQGQIDCAPCAPSSVRLLPNEVREFEWNRNALVSGVVMPPACYSGSPDSSCSQIVAAEPGDYGVIANGFSQCESGCQCDPATGVCNGAATGNQAYADFAKFQLPGSNAVDVVFGVCAFPCPGP